MNKTMAIGIFLILLSNSSLLFAICFSMIFMYIGLILNIVGFFFFINGARQKENVEESDSNDQI